MYFISLNRKLEVEYSRSILWFHSFLNFAILCSDLVFRISLPYKVDTAGLGLVHEHTHHCKPQCGPQTYHRQRFCADVLANCQLRSQPTTSPKPQNLSEDISRFQLPQPLNFPSWCPDTMVQRKTVLMLPCLSYWPAESKSTVLFYVTKFGVVLNEAIGMVALFPVASWGKYWRGIEKLAVLILCCSQHRREGPRIHKMEGKLAQCPDTWLRLRSTGDGFYYFGDIKRELSKKGY